MQSRKFLVGAAGLGLLAAFAVTMALFDHSGIAVATLAVLVAVGGLLSLTAVVSQRATARQITRLVRHGIHVDGLAAQTSQPTVTESDLVGTLRLLQAQYVGRLDRSQAALERAVEDLAGPAGAACRSGDGHVRIPRPDRDYVPVVKAALEAGLRVSVTADDEGLAAHWVESHGWFGAVTVSTGDGV